MKRLRPKGCSVRASARLLSAAGAVLLLSLAWFVPTANVGTTTRSAPASSARPAQGKDPDPAYISNPCIPGAKQVRWGSDRDDKSLKDYEDGDVICARKGNDTITVTKIGTTVWAGPGNDAVKMKNRLPNELRAGAGRDSARTDPKTTDRWYGDLEVKYRTSGADGLDDWTPARTSAQSWKYPAREPQIQCVIQNGERRLLIEPPPQIRAVDSTPRVDWQFVAWSPVLLWWDGQRWAFVVQNEWLWDRTYDETVQVFSGNVWRRFTSTGEKWHLWFFANRTGYFRVAVYYYHYASTGVPWHRVYDWVDQYGGDFAAPSQRWCNFTS